MSKISTILLQPTTEKLRKTLLAKNSKQEREDSYLHQHAKCISISTAVSAILGYLVYLTLPYLTLPYNSSSP
jgi:hypothetical protein